MQSHFTINPTHLTSKERFILKEVLLQHEEQNALWHGEEYEITVPNIDDPSISHSVKCKLTHDILIRKSENPLKKTSYDVMGEIIDSGNFSSIYEVKCTLGLLPDGYLWTTSHNQRVIKMERYSKYASNNPLNEYQLTKQSGEVKVKLPVIIYYESEEEFISFTTLERLTGKTLIEFIDNLNDEVNPIEKLMALTFRLIECLERLHQNGIIHRDLTPNNIFIDPNTFELHIFDFGMSRSLTETFNGRFNGGTPGFAPPEAYLALETNERSDIFSLAIIIAILWGAKPMSKYNEGEKCLTGLDDLMKYEFKNLAHGYFNRKNIKEFSQVLDKMLNSHRNHLKEKLKINEEDDLSLGNPLENEDLKSAIIELRDERLSLQKVINKLKNIFLNYFVANYQSKFTNDIFKASQIAFELKAQIGKCTLANKEFLLDSAARVRDKQNVMNVFTVFLGIHAFLDCNSHQEFISKIETVENMLKERTLKLTTLKEEIIKLSSMDENHRFANEILQQIELSINKTLSSYNDLTIDQIVITTESFNRKFDHLVAKLQYVKDKYINKISKVGSFDLYHAGIPGTVIFPRSKDHVDEPLTQIKSHSLSN